MACLPLANWLNGSVPTLDARMNLIWSFPKRLRDYALASWVQRRVARPVLRALDGNGLQRWSTAPSFDPIFMEWNRSSQRTQKGKKRPCWYAMPMTLYCFTRTKPYSIKQQVALLNG